MMGGSCWRRPGAVCREALAAPIHSPRARPGRGAAAGLDWPRGPVALYGMPYQIDKVLAVADKYGIAVIEDAAEGMGSRFDSRVLGTFGAYGVLSFNGNKMITTSGGGALICRSAEAANTVMWYATQARDAYPYYQHTAIGYNYRMSNSFIPDGLLPPCGAYGLRGGCSLYRGVHQGGYRIIKV